MTFTDHSMANLRYRAPDALGTLVVATCGRSEVLIDCLRSIPLEERPHFRVIVVDQNDSPFLTDALAPLQQEMDLEHLRVALRNASHARNFGAAHSSTAWVAFPDDDCRFLHDTLTVARERLSRGDLDLLTGQLVDETGRPHIIPWPPIETGITPESFERCFAESTFFMRKDVFDRVQGFDPAFGPGTRFPSAEGAEMLCRLWRAGVALRGLYTPAVRFFHPNKDNGNSPEVHARVEKFAFGEAAFTLRHYAVLPMKRIGLRLAAMTVRVIIGRPRHRRRRFVYLRGFLRGVFAYSLQPRPAETAPPLRTPHARS